MVQRAGGVVAAWWRSGVVALGMALLSSSAYAQSDARRALVQRALAAREAGDHTTALSLFEQAGVIEMRPGLRLSIAQEQQALGMLLPSCETASRCVAELQAALGSPESARLMPACAEIAVQSCRGFARVRVSVASSLRAGSEVRVQERVVPITQGDGQAFVEPGLVWVELMRDGRAVQSRRLDAVAGATVTASFDASAAVPAAVPVAEPAAVPAAVPVATPSSAVERAAPPRVLAGEERAAGVSVVTPHPAEPAPLVRAPLTSQWWFWTAVSAVVIGGTLGGLAAGGVFDGAGGAPEGVLYTVDALRGR